MEINFDVREDLQLPSSNFDSSESFGDPNYGEDEDETQTDRKGKEKKSKTGRKAQWPTDIVNDLIDIILEDEKFKTKLLLTNVKNVKNSEYYQEVVNILKSRCEERGESLPYDVKQTREKFKRCVSICREAALKIKTASGISRFQEEKEYGNWFNKLFAVVKCMDNCDPTQAIEPSQLAITTTTDRQESSTGAEEALNTDRKRKAFVPIHETSKKRKPQGLEKALEKIEEELNENRKTTKELLDLLKEDGQRQREQDDRFMGLMERFLQASQPPPQRYFSQESTTNMFMSPQNHRYGMTNRTPDRDNSYFMQ